MPTNIKLAVMFFAAAVTAGNIFSYIFFPTVIEVKRINEAVIGAMRVVLPINSDVMLLVIASMFFVAAIGLVLQFVRR